MKCSKCGFENANDFKFCKNCGNPLAQPNYNAYPQNSQPYQTQVQNPYTYPITPQKKRSKLFGFRSDVIWKKALAIIYLISTFCLLFGVFSNINELDVTSKDKLISRLGYLLMFLGNIALYIWLCDFIPFKVKLVEKGQKAVVVIIAIVLAVVPWSISASLDSYKSDEYNTAYSQQQKKQEEESKRAEQSKKAEKESKKNAQNTEKPKGQEKSKKTAESKTTKKNNTSKSNTNSNKQKEETTKRITAKKTTKKNKKEKTTKDSLHDNIVDSNEELTLMMMSEDVAQLYSKYPATTEIDPYSYAFEQKGLKYTVNCIFNCSNAYGVPETHILSIVAKYNTKEKKLHPYSISIDGVAVTNK